MLARLASFNTGILSPFNGSKAFLCSMQDFFHYKEVKST